MAGFQKKSAKSKVPDIPGTKQSIKTFSLLTPTGISSLDGLTGGGFPIGTLVVANSTNEDARGYTKVVLNHFLSQGMNHYGHDLFFASGTGKKLDKVSLIQSKHEKQKQSDDDQSNMSTEQHGKTADHDDLKIAWRYKDVKGSVETKANCPVAAELPANQEAGKTGSLTQWCPTDEPCFESGLFAALFKRLHGHAQSYEINCSRPNILRVGLSEMDSPLMAASDDTSPAHNNGLAHFMFALKSLARHKLTVIVLTLSGVSDDRSSLMELSDFWFDLAGAPKEQNHSASRAHHGVFTIAKLPNLKTIKCPIASSYGRYHFKSTKSKFSLEKIHLPPAEFEQPGTNVPDKPSLHTIGNDW